MKSLAKNIVAAFVILAFNNTVSACPWCRVQVKDGVYNEDFFGNLFVLLLPVVVIAALGFGLYHADKISGVIRRLR